MVGIAQSVERLVVVQKVAGSSPVTHPDEIGMNVKMFMPIFCICQVLRCASLSPSGAYTQAREILRLTGRPANPRTGESQYSALA